MANSDEDPLKKNNEYRLKEMEISISRQRMENDFNLKQQELDIQKSEQARKLSESQSLFKNPVFLTAFFAAIVAALANAYVALMNNNTLLDVETHKETEEQVVEAKKAEFTRLLEVSKLDIEPAKQKIKAFCDMLLITDPRICIVPILVTKNASPTPSANTYYYITANWDSDWVGGGYTQDEMCNKGVLVLGADDKYKGKTISRLSASEDVRKDFLGHVEYKYHCTYKVSGS